MNASICVITLLPTSPLTCQAISPAKLSHAFLSRWSFFIYVIMTYAHICIDKKA